MAAITRSKDKSGNVTYRIRVRIKGHPTKSASFPSRQEALEWSVKTEHIIRSLKYFPERIHANHTLAEAIERYLAEILPHKRPNTIKFQTQQLHYWKAKLGGYKLSDISPDMIARYRDELSQKRKSSTVNRYIEALSHTFTVAIKEWDWLLINPMMKVRKPKEPRGRTRFLSHDERERLLYECKASRCKILYKVVVLALSTGCRRMELLSLKWDDIALDRGTIYIQESKNGETRSIPLTGVALELITELCSQHRNAGSDYIFPSRDGTKPLEIRRSWEQALRRAHITDFRFHDLRHTTASYLAMSGASLIDIAAILGHRDIKQTMRYAHLSQHHTRSILERMTSTL